MKFKLIFFLIFLVLFVRAIERKPQIDINQRHKNEIVNWFKLHLKGKLTQQEYSLLAQRIYYLFELENEIFKSNDINKNRISQITQAIDKINQKIKKLENGEHNKKAFQEIVKKLNKFNINIKNDNNEKKMFNFFQYINGIYNVINSELNNKNITIGPDKNKKLTKLNIPTENEIKALVNRISKNKTKKTQKKFKIIVLTPEKNTRKIKLIQDATIIPLTPIQTPQKKIQPQSQSQIIQPIKTNLQPKAPASQQTDLQPITTVSQPNVIQTTQPMPTIDSTDLGFESNNLCSFLNDFQTLPVMPNDIPENISAQDLNTFIKNFNDTIKNLNSFISDYSNSLKNWQANNELQNFSALINATQLAKSNHDNIKASYDNCVNNAQSVFKTSCTDEEQLVAKFLGTHKCDPQLQPQAACSTELLNYINATNSLYDAYEAVLNFLNKYNLAPTWAVPVIRQNQNIGVTENQQTKIATINNQVVGINTIQGFNATDIVNQINLMIQFLKTNTQPCYDAIKTINNAITSLNNNIQTISNTIKVRITQLQTAKSIPQTTTPTGLAQGVALTEQMLGLGLDIGGITGIVGSLDMPAFAATQIILDKIASVTGADNGFMNSISAQISKNLINDWSFKDTSAQGIVTSLGKGILDIIETMAFGPVSLLAAAQASTTAILSGEAQSIAQAGQSATTAAGSITAALGDSNNNTSGNQDNCTQLRQTCICSNSGKSGECWTCMNLECIDKYGPTALLCNCSAP